MADSVFAPAGACSSYLLGLGLLQLLLSLVDQRIEHGLDVPHHVHHDSVVVGLGDEQYLADVGESRNDLLLQLLGAFRLSNKQESKKVKWDVVRGTQRKREAPSPSSA